MRVYVVFAVQDGGMLWLGVRVFDSHILQFDKNSRPWTIQYCPFIVICASYLDKYLYLCAFTVIKCRKKYAMPMSQAARYSNICEVEIL